MNKILLVGVICLISGLAFAGADQQSNLPTPQSLIAEIQSTGANDVSNRLWQDQDVFMEISKKIETGNRSWLKVADQLVADSTPAAKVSLINSVARSLAKQPENVFNLSKIKLEEVCSEPNLDSDKVIALKELKRVREALYQISKPRYMKKKTACLKLIETKIAELKK